MIESNYLKLVFSSAGAVYGNAKGIPIPEETTGATVNPHGASKWMVERIFADYRAAYQLNSVCLRYFNASGADFSGELGE